MQNLVKKEKKELKQKFPKNFEALLQLLIEEAIEKKPGLIYVFFADTIELILESRIEEELGKEVEKQECEIEEEKIDQTIRHKNRLRITFDTKKNYQEMLNNMAGNELKISRCFLERLKASHERRDLSCRSQNIKDSKIQNLKIQNLKYPNELSRTPIHQEKNFCLDKKTRVRSINEITLEILNIFYPDETKLNVLKKPEKNERQQATQYEMRNEYGWSPITRYKRPIKPIYFFTKPDEYYQKYGYSPESRLTESESNLEQFEKKKKKLPTKLFKSKPTFPIIKSCLKTKEFETKPFGVSFKETIESEKLKSRTEKLPDYYYCYQDPEKGDLTEKKKEENNKKAITFSPENLEDKVTTIPPRDLNTPDYLIFENPEDPKTDELKDINKFMFRPTYKELKNSMQNFSIESSSGSFIKSNSYSGSFIITPKTTEKHDESKISKKLFQQNKPIHKPIFEMTPDTEISPGTASGQDICYEKPTQEIFIHNLKQRKHLKLNFETPPETSFPIVSESYISFGKLPESKFSPLQDEKISHAEPGLYFEESDSKLSLKDLMKKNEFRKSRSSSKVEQTSLMPIKDNVEKFCEKPSVSKMSKTSDILEKLKDSKTESKKKVTPFESNPNCKPMTPDFVSRPKQYSQQPSLRNKPGTYDLSKKSNDPKTEYKMRGLSLESKLSKKPGISVQLKKSKDFNLELRKRFG